MHFGVLGVSYQSAPIEVRDAAALPDTRKIEAFEQLQQAGALSSVIVSTCNRSEAYFLYEQPQVPARVRQAYLALFEGEDVGRYLFERTGSQAVEYLFEVAGGLQSLVVGEDQILGQVQQALEFSRRAGFAGKEMTRIFRDAVTSAKKIKTQLKISEHPLSVCYIGIQRLEAACPLAGKSALVIGSGKMAALALAYLYEYGAGRVTVCNRSMERALQLREKYPALEVAAFSQRYAVMAGCDVVISATASPHLVLQRWEAPPAVRPLFLLDLASPRDIDPGFAGRENTTLFDIDSLRQTAQENLEKREHLVQQARQMAAAEAEQTVRWLAGSRVDPAIASMQRRCLEVEDATYEMLVDKLDLSGHEQKVLRKILHAGMKRLMREPIMSLKALEDESQQDNFRQVVCHLFGEREG